MQKSFKKQGGKKHHDTLKKGNLNKKNLQDLDISDDAMEELLDEQQDINDEREELKQEELEEAKNRPEDVSDPEISAIEDELEEGEKDANFKKPETTTIFEKFIKEKGQNFDLTVINNKIQDLLKVLSNFAEEREGTKSRESYVLELADYLCTYYGYNRELIDVFMATFNPNECVQFLEANEQQRPITIRTNTLKTKRKELAQNLIQRGVNLDPLAEWTKVGLKIYESKVPIGATPEYLAGHYMLQSGSSLLPVMSLAPQINERILDMAAAPGGKTTYIAQLMKNTGVLFANDSKKERLKALKFNLQRMGVHNCVITNYDGRKFPKVMKNFDRVLLDAPCTGLGIIAKDPSIKTQKTLRDIRIHSHLQKELILSAIDCCKKGGYIVYSTCSVTVQENEWVVDYALRNRYVKIVPTGLEIGEDGIVKWEDKRFNPNLKLSKRILPHIHNMDGFFVAKLKKLDNGSKKKKEEGEKQKEEPLSKKKKKKLNKAKIQKKKQKLLNKVAEEEAQKEKDEMGVEEENVEQETKEVEKKKKKKKIEAEEEVVEQKTEVVEKKKKKQKKEKKVEELKEEKEEVEPEKKEVKSVKKKIEKKKK